VPGRSPIGTGGFSTLSIEVAPGGRGFYYNATFHCDAGPSWPGAEHTGWHFQRGSFSSQHAGPAVYSVPGHGLLCACGAERFTPLRWCPVFCFLFPRAKTSFPNRALNPWRSSVGGTSMAIETTEWPGQKSFLAIVVLHFFAAGSSNATPWPVLLGSEFSMPDFREGPFCSGKFFRLRPGRVRFQRKSPAPVSRISDHS